MKIQMNPTQKTAETNRNNPFHLSLSISTRTVNEKKEGESVTEFFLKENIHVNKTELTPILTKHLHSTNLWYKNKITSGISRQENYSGMSGIIVDYDNTMTIQQFKKLYLNYHFVLYPSSSHGLEDEHGLKMEKFHVIFPIDPKDHDNYKKSEMHLRTYQ
jgi:hypothetical protein